MPQFAQGKAAVVVMGFDADICVRANLFGAPDHLPAGGLAPPLTSVANVVTSRALLVTGGTIYPVNHLGAYGVLFNT